MAVFKLTSTRPLPAGAEIVTRAGKPHVRLTERGRSVYYPLSKDGTKYLQPGKCWYVEYLDENDVVRRKKGFADRAATEALGIELRKKVDRAKLGFTDPAEEHGRVPLAAHLKDYAAVLTAKWDTEKHVRHTLGMLAALFAGVGAVFPRDVTEAGVVDWLNARRRGGAAADPPPCD